MLTITFRFDSGQYHATPWDHHVNEGVPEWPPSPFRLLRSITAVALQRTELDEDTINGLLTVLSANPPRLGCVPITQMQTRHYLPNYNDKTAKVLDTAAVVDQALVNSNVRDDSGSFGPRYHTAFNWPNLDLSSEMLLILQQVLAQMTYFGRAESWATAEVFSGDVKTMPRMRWMAPLGAESIEEQQSKGELQSYPYPLPELVLADWNASWLEQAVERELSIDQLKALEKGKELDVAKRRKQLHTKFAGKQRLRAFDVLVTETSDMQKEGWSRPPGTYDVRYRRPEGLVVSTAPTAPAPSSSNSVKHFLRLQITNRVLPPFTDAHVLARNLRAALISRVQRFYDKPIEEMSELPQEIQLLLGRDAQGQTLTGRHVHLHVTCEPDERGVSVASFLLFVPIGIPEVLQKAIRASAFRLTKGWGEKQQEGRDVAEDNSWHLSLTWEGSLDDQQTPRYLSTRQSWVSVTPFASTLNIKHNKLATWPEHIDVLERRPARGNQSTAASQGELVRMRGKQVSEEKLQPHSNPVWQGSPVHDLLRLMGEHHLDAFSLLERVVVYNAVPGAATESTASCRRRLLAFAEFRIAQRDFLSRKNLHMAAFELHFSSPVQGPFALGFGAHFSLGLFRPMSEQELTG
jgi:CRISPR-associated protein Csb2